MKLFKGLNLWKLGGIVLVLALLGTVACSRSGSGAIKISSWGDANENAILTNLINDFQKSHPTIKVELQRVPWGEYNTKLLTQIAAGIAPDVIFVSTDNISDYYPRGVLEPLDEYMKGDPSFPVNDFYPTLMERFRLDGHLYVIPRDISPICVVYYNKKAFDAAKLSYPSDDWDWDDFLAKAKVLTKRTKDGKTTQWGFTEDWAMIEPWIYDNGGRWVDNPQKPNQWAFNTKAFIDGVQFRADLILKHKVMPGPSNMTAMGGIGSSDMFMNGTVAMFLSGFWKTPQFRGIKNFDWDIAMFPKSPSGQRGFQSGGSGYGILKSSKNKKAAWELVKYIGGVEGEKKLGATGLSQPALKNLAESPLFLDGQVPHNKKMLLRAEPYGVFNPMATNFLEIYQGNVIPLFDQIWNGKLTAAEAVEKLNETLKNKPLIVKAKEN
jgi:multiple sugar transport system substrate-binding protein